MKYSLAALGAAALLGSGADAMPSSGKSSNLKAHHERHIVHGRRSFMDTIHNVLRGAEPARDAPVARSWWQSAQKAPRQYVASGNVTAGATVTATGTGDASPATTTGLYQNGTQTYIAEPISTTTTDLDCTFQYVTQTQTLEVTVSFTITEDPYMTAPNNNAQNQTTSSGYWNSTLTTAPLTTTDADLNATATITTNNTSIQTVVNPVVTDGGHYTNATTIVQNGTTTTECTDDEVTATLAPTLIEEPCPEGEVDITSTLTDGQTTTVRVTLSSFATITPTLGPSSTSTATTTTCVIDTELAPVVTATATATVSPPTVVPTRTVCESDAPTGTPRPRDAHCGVHGKPVGDYFMAQYVQNKKDVPVTLEGCYQFCQLSFDENEGCHSYEFYLEPGLGAPRCNLYSSSVAFSLKSIDNNQPNTWFDLGCGDPEGDDWRNGGSGGGHNNSTIAPVRHIR